MKRALLLLSLLIGLFQLPARAQNANAAAIADKEAAEEKYNRVAADLEKLQTDYAALLQKVEKLDDQLQKLREEQSRLANKNDSSTKEDIKELKEKIEEVDRKRESDNQVISESVRKAFKQLESMVQKGAIEPHRSTIKPSPPETAPAAPASSDKGFPHKIAEGDTLSGIVSAYNTEFKSKKMKTITMNQVKEANPKVNWNRLKVGQTIIIPAPASAN